MRLIDRRAAGRRGLACIVAIVLCLAPAIPEVRAQETPAGGPAAIDSAGEPVLLREQPGYDAAVLATLGDGNPVEIAGQPITAADGTSWVPVVAGGQSGYVPAGFVAAAATTVEPAVAPVAVPESVPETTAPPGSADSVAAPALEVTAPSPGTTGTITTEANLRSGPSVDTAVLTVLPPRHLPLDRRSRGERIRPCDRQRHVRLGCGRAARRGCIGCGATDGSRSEYAAH
jgi:hypothetical protein